MADTAIAITAGSGTNVDTRTEATNGNHRQVVVIGDPSTNAGVAPVDVTNGLAVQIIPALPAGTNAIGKLAANSGVDIGDVDVTSVPTDPFGANADAASVSTSISAKLKAIATALGVTALDLGSGTGGTRTLRFFSDTAQWTGGSGAISAATQRVALATDSPGIITTGTLGTPSSAVLTVQGGVAMTPVSNRERLFSAAATTLTRPANTTAYTANDSISDNATAGSVTALSAILADVNDDPISITEVVLVTTDTGLQGKNVRAYLYNSNPTSNTGVGAGDNVAFSNKQAGFIGTVSGLMRTFSDGASGRLVPDEGSQIIAAPTSGAKTIFIQYQTLDAFTPSANSTTLIGTIKGVQGRAA